MKSFTNQEIAHMLRNVAAAFAIQDEKKFRFQIIAYQNAADAIARLTTEISHLVQEDKLDEIPGVGASIKGHLDELFKTGRVKHFESVLENVPPAIFPLLDIPSFGPKKAYKLVAAFKLENPKTVIDDLEKIAKDGKIAGLEGFGEKSQSDIQRAIGEFREGFGKTTRMALPFAAEIAAKLIAYLKSSPKITDAQTLGSLRRMRETIGDIDIAVATNDPAAAIEHFLNFPQKERDIEKGDISAAMLTSGGKQVDLLVQPKGAFGSLLQHFTGSKNHNVHLRELAIKKGMSLSEKGIKTKTGMKSYDTEEKFYKALGMDWVPPEMREDTGEIELAIKHNLPKLVELKDLKGDLHIHSSYPIQPSHDLGQNTMEEMLEKATSLGYSYLAFSEHNPSVSKHTQKQVYDIMKKRQEKIESLRNKYKDIHIISSCEVDILANGDIALDDKSLELVDMIQVSIHSSFATERKKMTKRIIGGLSHPKAKIFSHPTGRLLNQRPGYEFDTDEVFAFCKENDKALEINAWPSRLDLPDVLVRKAVDSGIKMTISTDAHAAWQMDMMRYGVAVARRGWATKDDILNTLEYNKFISWFKS